MIVRKSANPNLLTIAGTKSGEPVCIDVSKPIMAGICGSTGTGKSVLLMNLVLLSRNLMKDRIQFVAFDPKVMSLYPIRHVLSKPPITEPSEYSFEISELNRVLDKRLAMMRDLGTTKIDPVSDGHRLPMIVAIFEECLSFLHSPELDAKTNSFLCDSLVSYATRCRAANMGFIVCSHDFADGSSGIPKQVRSSCRTRFLFKNGINECTTFTEKMPERAPSYNLSKPGLFYVSDNDLTKWVKAMTEYKTDGFYEEFSGQLSAYNRDVDPELEITGLFS